ncbi:hypothetical protein MIND_00691500 [Mycena indigotica]|uniref:Uncharacterized protein n=1 Tax=Mycena indigotica TaxID=2126181 RepID=A0A8H6SLY9_9AGAR|nr:uncharacterized protein MIND_00691500 [Mycena indigotica]KAF7301267.1 hypothetical protein MIND_00691500 [Mycena indigotica]
MAWFTENWLLMARVKAPAATVYTRDFLWRPVILLFDPHALEPTPLAYFLRPLAASFILINLFPDLEVFRLRHFPVQLIRSGKKVVSLCGFMPTSCSLVLLV